MSTRWLDRGQLRYRVQSCLQHAGLLSAAGALWRWARLVRQPSLISRELATRKEYLDFERCYGPALGCRLCGRTGPGKTALVVSVGFPSGVKAELGLIKGLQAAGYEVVAVMKRDTWLMKYYRLAGVHRLIFWDEFAQPLSVEAGEAAFETIRSSDDLLSFEHAGTRTGRCIASTALRNLRVGSLDLASQDVRLAVRPYFVSGLTYARAARKIIQTILPDIAMFVDRGYTPQGELFDACLSSGVDVFTWNAAHRGNLLIFKRYTRETRDDHPASLSEASWNQVRIMPWTEAHRRHLQDELFGSYARGDWYSEVGTQFKARLVDAQEIKGRLRLDPHKKTAVIFPHILWDGTFFWGTDLFRSYEEWFLETIRAAIANRSVNWIIKVHPANVVKDARDGIKGEPAEVAAIRNHIGTLPDHIRIIPADSDISTFSLFSVTDYCLTVRGTIGIEAACLGIPVLTAGTGRYDHKGFTIDSESRDEYLSNLSTIQDIPPLRPAQRELAERFAYAILIMRTLPLTTFTLEYRKDSIASIETKIQATGPSDWLSAPDLKAFIDWVAHPQRLDFLSTSSGPAREDAPVGSTMTSVK